MSLGQVFAATHSGHTSRWSYKNGGSAVVLDSSANGGINFLVCHREGCRRVLVMAGTQSPIVIRDAFSGLLLRSLEVVQNSVYKAIFLGGELYTAGSRCIVLYDYASGEKKQKISTESDVCSLAASSRYLLACCYDANVRIYCRQSGELVNVVKIESSHKLIICSAVYKHKASDFILPDTLVIRNTFRYGKRHNKRFAGSYSVSVKCNYVRRMLLKYQTHIIGPVREHILLYSRWICPSLLQIFSYFTLTWVQQLFVVIKQKYPFFYCAHIRFFVHGLQTNTRGSHMAES